MYDNIVLTWSNLHKDVRQRAKLHPNGDIVYTYRDSEWGRCTITIHANGSETIIVHQGEGDIPINE